MKLLYITILTLCIAVTASAEKKASSYVLNADHIEYGKDSNIIIAKGNVEIFKDNYTLRADKIIYDKNKNTAFAYQNVLLINPNGEKTYATYVELNNVLKEGLSENLTAYLKDNDIFIAKKAEYKPNNVTVFEKVKYTPCPLCKDKSPQWQIKARKATYISKETVTFKHSVFEVYGVPMFYTPYFQTHAPNAPPRSGFLFPKKYKYKDVYGHSLTLPFYYRIADNKDLLYSPMITSRQGILHQAKYRHLTKNGYYELEGNYINPKHNTQEKVKNRYHIKGYGENKINDNFSLKAYLNKVSDLSYLHNYWDINENYLTSDVTLEYDKNRDYGHIRSMYFQELRSTPQSLSNPIILPLADYHKEFFYTDNKFTVNINMINLLRKSAQLNTKRLSTSLSWDKEYVINNHNINLTQRVNTSIFNFSKNNVLKDSNTQKQDKNISRVTPESEILWTYPLISFNKNYTLYITPSVNPILSPNSSKNNKIVNEDSKGIELTDINLFSSNRYAGYDQIESGNRVNYGINGELSMNTHRYSFLLGQVWKQKKSKDYPINSGLHNKTLSDYVGNIAAHPLSWLSIYYRFRIDNDHFIARKQEIDNQINIPLNNDFINSISIGNQITKLNYKQSNNIALDSLNKVIAANTRINFLKEWFIEASTSRNYTKTKQFFVQASFSLGYTGQCTTFKLSAIKDFTHDAQRNIKSNKGITFDWDIQLKNVN